MLRAQIIIFWRVIMQINLLSAFFFLHLVFVVALNACDNFDCGNLLYGVNIQPIIQKGTIETSEEYSLCKNANDVIKKKCTDCGYGIDQMQSLDRIISVYLKEDDAKWESAVRNNAKEDYERYLKIYSNGKHAIAANNAIHKLSTQRENDLDSICESLKISNNIDEISSFLKNNPKQKYQAVLNPRIALLTEENDWQKAVGMNNERYIESYLSTYPTGRHVKEAEKALTIFAEISLKTQDSLYKVLKNAKKANDIRAFMEKYPNSKYNDSLQPRLSILEKKEQINIKKEEKSQEILDLASNICNALNQLKELQQQIEHETMIEKESGGVIDLKARREYGEMKVNISQELAKNKADYLKLTGKKWTTINCKEAE